MEGVSLSISAGIISSSCKELLHKDSECQPLEICYLAVLTLTCLLLDECFLIKRYQRSQQQPIYKIAMAYAKIVIIGHVRPCT